MSGAMSANDDITAMSANGNNHDHLCPPPWKWGEGGHCEGCELITKVREVERAKRVSEDQWISAREAREQEEDIRADERKLILARIDGVFVDDAVSWNRALLAAIAAIKGEW